VADHPRWEEIPEAPLREADAGLVPAGEGWFVVNVAEAQSIRSSEFGDACRFEDRPALEFPEFGINVRVLQPGQPNCRYHRENAQEVALVLSGECVAIVEDRERPMRPGDLLYAPAGTAHVIVGAGSGPCAVLMVGTRKDPEELLYPVSAVAARYGASVERETPDEEEAYADATPRRPVSLRRVPW
jgi:uncharacterized cupin superfamily protein